MVCIFFPDLQGAPKKVVFGPTVDNFELLQVQNFLNIYYNQTNSSVTNDNNFRIQIMVNGVVSRPIVSLNFKF